MGSDTGTNALALLPEILLVAGGLAVLLAGSFLPRTRQRAAHILALVMLFASLGATVAASTGIPTFAFSGTYLIDTSTQLVRIVVVGATALVLLAARGSIAGSVRESETYALVLFSAAGTVVVASAGDLLVLAVGFLLASVPLYGLIGMVATTRGAEAALKTYLLGALFGILLLAGVTLLYGVTGTTVYAELLTTLGEAPPGVAVVGAAAVLSGLMFKAGAVPAHFWVPDAAQGSSGLVATFLTTVPKLGAFVAAFRIVDALPDAAGATLF
ncbi:MAG TPA: proton-conducting transporter membrane subunit, partial [Demequina sp.]|nr:proton-conducting transporter membrane subunit [Demequina sp.]